MKMFVFEEMPCEILVKIFSFLDEESLVACEKVCRRFKPIAHHQYIKNYNNILKQNQLLSLTFLPFTIIKKMIFYDMCVPYVMLGLSPTPGKVEPSGIDSLSTDIMYHFGHLREIDSSNWMKRFLKAAILMRAFYSCKSYVKDCIKDLPRWPSLHDFSAVIELPNFTILLNKCDNLWLLIIFYTIFLKAEPNNRFLVFGDNFQFTGKWDSDRGDGLKISFALRGSKKVIKTLKTCGTCKLIEEIPFDDIENETLVLRITMESTNSKNPFFFEEFL